MRGGRKERWRGKKKKEEREYDEREKGLKNERIR